MYAQLDDLLNIKNQHRHMAKRDARSCLRASAPPLHALVQQPLLSGGDDMVVVVVCYCLSVCLSVYQSVSSFPGSSVGGAQTSRRHKINSKHQAINQANIRVSCLCLYLILLVWRRRRRRRWRRRLCQQAVALSVPFASGKDVGADAAHPVGELLLGGGLQLELASLVVLDDELALAGNAQLSRAQLEALLG